MLSQQLIAVDPEGRWYNMTLKVSELNPSLMWSAAQIQAEALSPALDPNTWVWHKGSSAYAVVLRDTMSFKGFMGVRNENDRHNGHPILTPMCDADVVVMPEGCPRVKFPGTQRIMMLLSLTDLDISLGLVDLSREDTRIALPPFPNVHGDGRVCQAAEAGGLFSNGEGLKAWMDRKLKLFDDSTWNRDLMPSEESTRAEEMKAFLRFDAVTGEHCPSRPICLDNLPSATFASSVMSAALAVLDAARKELT